MSKRQLKTGYFVLEGLNSFATTYYLYYLYFFMQTAFGFSDRDNLALAAFNGFIYMVGSFFAGRFAQTYGYFTALKVGFATSISSLFAGSLVHSAAGQITLAAVVVLGICFTWPPLEALVSEGEPPAGLQRMVGLYNMVWAGTGAVSYFVGGAMLHNIGLKSLFFLPAAIQIGQLLLTFRLGHQTRLLFGQQSLSTFNSATGAMCASAEGAEQTSAHEPPRFELNPRPIAKARTFLSMAWLTNPFAYVAINTLVAVIPGIAKKLELSTTLAGFSCSIWCFARMGAFWGLWHWDGWHYRFRWLLAAYLTLMGTFTMLVLAPGLVVLVLAQILFGFAAGLIYYSSLFYSMDLSASKGEHGGIHEAAIGLGNFAGPVFGAGALYFLPQYVNSSSWAVSGLLCFGLAGLIGIWRKNK